LLKVTAAFRDTEALAAFANLDPENADAVAYFRNNYPDFAPSEWWDYKYEEHSLRSILTESELEKDFATWDPTKPAFVIDETPVLLWQVTQEEIQRAWGNQFKFETVFGLTQLLKCVFVAPPETVWTQEYMHFPDGMFDELIGNKTYSFHAAVLYLNEHPTQAKICARHGCGKYFVSAHGKRAFCLYPDEHGDTCSAKQIAEQQIEWWRTKGNKQRKAKQKSARKSVKNKTAR
jgi:hypothetical protein